MTPPPRSTPRSVLSGELDSRTLHAARTAEAACRRLSQACMEVASSGLPGLDRCMHALMDSSYVAAASARILSRLDRHELGTMVSMLEVCARLALANAEACGHETSAPSVISCSEISRECSRACSALLEQLEQYGAPGNVLRSRSA